MNRSLANGVAKIPAKIPAMALALGVAVLAAATGSHGAAAQGMMTPPGQAAAPGAPQCNDFVTLREDTEKKAAAINAINKNHGDRKEMCAAITKFTAAEAAVLKFLEDNKTWCGIPDVAVTNAKAGHEKTVKFRDVVCAEAPKPKAPTLSDAIGTPSLDTDKNTKTGPGTFDTLTGNPLAK